MFEQYDIIFRQYDLNFGQYGPMGLDRSMIDPGSILDLSMTTTTNVFVYLFYVFFRDLSRKMRRNKLAPETRKQSRAPDNIKMMSKILKMYFTIFLLPVGDPCRGNIPGQNVHFIDLSVK